MKLHPTPEKAVGPEVKHALIRVNVSEYSDNRYSCALHYDDFSGPEC
ncbi:hypothetical protein OOK27_11545 [Streptomyces canus]|nr:hypothetical protein [Streptomyces canus]MCX5254804.1 hypothetical protein [Streptomyces canus]